MPRKIKLCDPTVNAFLLHTKCSVINSRKQNLGYGKFNAASNIVIFKLQCIHGKVFFYFVYVTVSFIERFQMRLATALKEASLPLGVFIFLPEIKIQLQAST